MPKNETLPAARWLEQAVSDVLPGPEYEALFWQAFLGSRAYGLWQILSNWQAAMEDDSWPPISRLIQLMGSGASRATILGRESCPGRPAQDGLLSVLQKEGLIDVEIQGDSPTRRQYVFAVRPRLPLLSRAQVAQLDPHVQDLHREWLLLHELYRTWQAL